MIGQTISHHRVVEKVGGGGMGVAYKVEDVTLHRFVALKFLPLQRCRRPDCIFSELNPPRLSSLYASLSPSR